MYNRNKAQQSKNRVHISWDILYYGLEISNHGIKVKATEEVYLLID